MPITHKHSHKSEEYKGNLIKQATYAQPLPPSCTSLRFSLVFVLAFQAVIFTGYCELGSNSWPGLGVRGPFELAEAWFCNRGSTTAHRN